MNQAFKAMMGTTNRLEQLPKVSSAFKRLAFVNFRTTLLRQEVGRLGSHRFEINTCALWIELFFKWSYPDVRVSCRVEFVLTKIVVSYSNLPMRELPNVVLMIFCTSGRPFIYCGPIVYPSCMWECEPSINVTVSKYKATNWCHLPLEIQKWRRHRHGTSEEKMDILKKGCFEASKRAVW